MNDDTYKTSYAYKAGYLESAIEHCVEELQKITKRGGLNNRDQFCVELILERLDDALKETAPP